MLASGRNVNVLVLDTEVYSNTGRQASGDAVGAIAELRPPARPSADLALQAIAYGNVYVARVAMGAAAQTLKAFREAEAYDGPSLIWRTATASPTASTCARDCGSSTWRSTPATGR